MLWSPSGVFTGTEVIFNKCECLPKAVPEGVVELYADDTTAYCIGDDMDVVTQQINLIFLAQIYKWSQRNKPSIHSRKNEAILFQRVRSLAHYKILITTTIGSKGRTIRKVMRGVGEKPKKNSCKGKCQEKKFVQRRRERKKIHAEGRSNCDFYLIYNICQQAC